MQISRMAERLHQSVHQCVFWMHISVVFCRVCEREGEKSRDRGRETENKTVWCMINDDKLHSLSKHNEFCNCNVIAFDLQNKLVMSTGSWRKYGKHNIALPQSSLIAELTSLTYLTFISYLKTHSVIFCSLLCHKEDIFLSSMEHKKRYFKKVIFIQQSHTVTNGCQGPKKHKTAKFIFNFLLT